VLQAFFPVDPNFSGDTTKSSASPAQKLIKLCKKFVNATISLHLVVSDSFLPTASKFHYVFNLRDLSNIFQVCHRDNVSNFTQITSLRGYAWQMQTFSLVPTA
jgi:AAA+ lid domain